MATFSQPVQATSATQGAGGNTGALVIITILFFMWGLLTALIECIGSKADRAGTGRHADFAGRGADGCRIRTLAGRRTAGVPG